MANALLNVTPERVTAIIVEVGGEEEEEEEEGRVSIDVRRALTVRSVMLKYKITVNDPEVTLDTLRAQLLQAAQEGKMNRDLRYYAA